MTNTLTQPSTNTATAIASEQGEERPLPVIIQGGMGVGVSGWRLANAVAKAGQLGIVSGTALATVLSRRLQQGDSGGHMRRAMAAFPEPSISERVLNRYFVEGGLPADKPYQLTQMAHLQMNRTLNELTMLANFVEVYLAKEGHDGVVGINYLEKIQLPTLPSLLGAMIAGVDYVAVGAGIPRQIPAILDAFASGKPAEMKVDVEGAQPGESHVVRLDPAELLGGSAPLLPRPRFLAIISSTTLAQTLARKSDGRVDGFIVEGHCAGGHNAPPRGTLQLSVRGEPIYGPRDEVDLIKLRAIGLPFWLAGSYATREKLDEARARGAVGVQIGTAFAFCEESGVEPTIRSEVLRKVQDGTADVRTEPDASPTGFPFKVVALEGSLSQQDVYESRERRTCDLGYLRRPYRKDDGTVGYRCPSEPVEHYLAKGGTLEETVGRKCVCNALTSTIGMGQLIEGENRERPLMTAGSDLVNIGRFFSPGATSYTAADVIISMLGLEKEGEGESAAPGVQAAEIVVESFGGPEVLGSREQSLAPLTEREVRVRLTSIGMNHADLMARRGEYRLSSGAPPFVPGIEGGGIVERVGSEVESVRVGQRVVLGLDMRSEHPKEDRGTYRTYYTCTEDQLVVAPAEIPDNQLGALWLSYLTAWGCLVWKQQIRQGDYVAIPAASSAVGLAAAQIVKQQGGIAIGLTTSDAKATRIAALPTAAYSHMIVTHRAGKPRAWYRDLRRATGGRGADVFFDPVGAGDYLDAEIRGLAQGGTIWIYGLLGSAGAVDLHPLIRKRGAIRGWLLSELSDSPADLRRGYEAILEGFSQGAFVQHVDQTFRLSDGQNAHALMETGRHVGKLVLVP